MTLKVHLEPQIHCSPAILLKKGHTHLHGRALHPRHARHPVQDSDSDGDSHKEATDKGPQVAPPCPGLLSHRLHREWQRR